MFHKSGLRVKPRLRDEPQHHGCFKLTPLAGPSVVSRVPVVKDGRMGTPPNGNILSRSLNQHVLAKLRLGSFNPSTHAKAVAGSTHCHALTAHGALEGEIRSHSLVEPTRGFVGMGRPVHVFTL